jgi:N utilization substance protein B
MEDMTKRELAFCYIYSQEVQKQNCKAQVKLFLDCLEIENGRDREYVKNVAQGIKEHDEEITKLISENLKTGWTIDRISTVDLALLKLAIYEINYIKTPFKIIINEEVNMAKKYGEESSAPFVNGVLASIVNKKPEE